MQATYKIYFDYIHARFESISQALGISECISSVYVLTHQKIRLILLGKLQHKENLRYYFLHHGHLTLLLVIIVQKAFANKY